MKKQEKQKIIDGVREKFEKASCAVLIKNNGLTVSEFTTLRNKLRAEKIDIKVVKNTLAIRSIEASSYSLLKDYYKGPTVTVWSYNDPVTLAKILTEFLKGQQKAEIIAGAISNKLLNANDINKLSTLPSKEELLSKMLGSLKSPTTGFVNVLAGIPRSFLNVLNAIKEQKQN
ncbi:MAG: 50S ribosomal protein L10 [Proteobacteria bacterium]|nr:50S ribosomal protein L10 [Pseudomonadota bacterium]